jgi:hypothetical protein
MDLYTQFDPLLNAIVEIARGQPGPRQEVEDDLERLDKQGWQIRQAVDLIWAGERDMTRLGNGLDEQDTLLVERILELLEESVQETQLPGTSKPSELANLERLVETLPADLVIALQSQNEQAFWEAVERLDPPEQEKITGQLELLQAQAEAAWLQMASQRPDQTEEMVEILRSLPIAVRIAILDQDAGELQTALAGLPQDQAETVLASLMESGLLQQAVNAEMQRALEELEPVLQAVASVAKGNQIARPQVDEFMATYLQDDLNLAGFRRAVLRIWDGERQLDILTTDLDDLSILLVKRVLELAD